MAQKLTTCTFCGTGCGIYLETDGKKITGAYPSMSHPANKGRISVRGWNVHEVASSQDRLMKPLIKKNGQFQEAGWDEALCFVAERLKQIRAKYGPDSIAFFNSPRCSNEETYLLQKIARTIIGTNNVDHGTGVYSNNSINVLMDMLGIPATTNSLEELMKSEVIIVDGVDLHMQLPTVGGWVIRAKLNGAKLIVVDARRHRVSKHADYFLQIRPGTEEVLYNAMAKVIVDRGLVNMKFIKDHCREYEAFIERIQACDLLWAAECCGVSALLIEDAAIAYAKAKRASLLYSTGTETRGVESIQALVNMVLMTGNIGKEGAGLFALVEQNNLQGVCDMGMLPDRLPGYKLVNDSKERAFFEKLWGVQLPSNPGFDARHIMSNQSQGQIKALWLCRYDPVSTAFFSTATDSLKTFDLVIAQHLFMTETAKYADVVLPIVAFGEERVTFTSTERRIQLAEKAIEPPEGPIPTWRQMVLIAQHLGAPWNYASSAEVMDEIGRVIPFYEGANYENLARDYGRQWPCTKDKPLGTRFLFEDGIQGKPFKFVPVQKCSVICKVNEQFPFALVLGRSLYYWHRNVLIRHSETMKREYGILLLDYPEGFVEINNEDAKKIEIRDGQKIRLVSNTGSSVTYARVTSEVRQGSIFVPYFVREVMEKISGGGLIQVDSQSKPVYVRVEKV